MHKKEYLRKTFSERGHFTNLPTLFPIKRLEICDNYLQIDRGGKTFILDWQDFISATLYIIKKSAKSCGQYASTNYTRQTLILKTCDNKFKIDVSLQFSDFNNSKEIISRIGEHIQITKNTSS